MWTLVVDVAKVMCIGVDVASVFPFDFRHTPSEYFASLCAVEKVYKKLSRPFRYCIIYCKFYKVLV